MKRFNIANGWTNTRSTLIVAEAVEIRAICKSLIRAELKTAYGNFRTNIAAMFWDEEGPQPHFNMSAVYGLEITRDGYWIVHNASTVLRYLECV